MGKLGRGVALLSLLAAGACECRSEPVAIPRPDPARPWTELSRCLTGDETPSRTLLPRVALSAQLEDVSDVTPPPVPAGQLTADETRNRPDDVRRWPRRCAHHARALAVALEGPERELARAAADELSEGELGDALFELVDHGAGWHTVPVQASTAPPVPASPLTRATRYLVEGPRCAPILVLPDISQSPPRQVAYISCHHTPSATCTFEGERLDQVRCSPSSERPDVWTLRETQVGSVKFRVRGRGESCRYEAGGDFELVGRADCGREGTWARPCKSESSLAAVFAHEGSTTSHVVMWRQAGYELFDVPLDVGPSTAVGCDDEAIRFATVHQQIVLIDTTPRMGDIRRPMTVMHQIEARRCTPAACETDSGEIESLGGSARVGFLGDHVLVSELVERREGDGLAVSYGPLSELSKHRLWVLEPETGQRLGHHLFLLTSANAAVVLLSDRDHGVFAIRLDADGGFDYLPP